MRMGGKSFARLHDVVVENAQGAPVEIARIEVIGEAEGMARLQPTVIEAGPLAGTLNEKAPYVLAR